MRVSIVTSVLNGAAHLQKCIDSIKAQTIPCEHLIVDGGSTDGSCDIARAAGLRVIEALNSSIGEAFNIGIQNCSGEVIAILNADDWLEPDAAERSIKALQANPQTGFTFGSVVLHYRTQSITVHPRVTVEDLAPYATKRMVFFHISSFVRRSVYEDYGLFDPNFKVAMDYDFYARITTRGVRGTYVPGIVAHARAGGVSSNTHARMRDYYRVLSRYHGRLLTNYYIVKYTINSFLYELLPPGLRSRLADNMLGFFKAPEKRSDMKKAIRLLVLKLPRPALLFIAVLFARMAQTSANSDGNVKEFRILTGPAKGLVCCLPVTEKWQAASFSLRLNEIEVCRALERLCKPGSVCLDLGASVGYHTLPLSRLCGMEGKVIAFEPNPASRFILERSVQRNQLQNISLEPYALSNRTGQMMFRSSGSIDGLGHLVGVSLEPNERLRQKEYMVQVISIDEYVEKERLSKVDVIKIDIEGAELLCLQGMKKTLQDKRPVIIVEFNGAQRIKEGTEFLARFGYNCQAIDSNNILARPS